MTAVAVVGMGCRFPPDTTGAAALWEFLRRGGDAVGEIPPDRWRWEAFYDPDPAKPGKAYVARGAFLSQPIEDFDAEFFGVSPREAAALDPQQRLLLEVSWEALEDAGVDIAGLRGSPTGVYVGCFMLDNLLQQAEPAARDAIGPQTPTACTNTVLASRLSYFYDLRGPSMAIDTACSSSLVALHEGARALAAGDCDLVLVGGVNRIFRPEPTLMMSKGHFLAADGRSKAFSAEADGYGRGEGCGVVILRRLDDAVRHGDRIYAVLEGTGVNQDGRTAGPALPSSAAQAALIASVVERAAIDPATIAYVEAHGTGTPAGDPAEMAALGEVIGRAPGRAAPCAVGSLKAGMGHMEGAAGIAGLMKAALVAFHREVPPQAWLDEPTPDIDFAGLGLTVAREPVPLGATPVRVAVNSFGYGGTNAHAILRSPPPAPDRLPVPRAEPFLPPVALVSGHTPGALAALAGSYATQLRDPALAGGDLRAAWARRTAHAHRAVIGGDPEDFAERLDQLAAGGKHPDVVEGRAVAGGPARPVFVFSGMGPHWWAMGRELITEHPVARAHVERCDAIHRRLAGWSVRDALLAPEAESRMHTTAVAQPAGFVLQTALAAVLADLGIAPGAIMGHSVGEVAAAHVSGCLDLQAALTVVHHRSRLQATLAGTGAMLATELAPDDARELVEPFGGAVSLAAVNSARSTTLAGEQAALEKIAAELAERELFARLLAVEVPYHSPAMDPILDPLREALAGVAPAAGIEGLYSTVAADHDGGGWDAAYWARNVRDPVDFRGAVGRVLADGHRLFVELAPHPVLSLYLRELAAGTRHHRIVPTLYRGRSDRRALLGAVAQLWVDGVAVDWRRVVGDGPTVPLPPYPWQRERHWQEPEARRRSRTGEAAHADVLHGSPVTTAPPTWDCEVSPTTIPWCRDHWVGGAPLFPMTGFLEMVVSHARASASGALPVVVEDLVIDAPLVLPEHQDPVLRLVAGDEGQVSLWSRRRGAGADWRRLGSARVGRGLFAARPAAASAGAPGTHLDAATVYSALEGAGFDYRGDFRSVARVALAGDIVTTTVALGGDPPDGYTAYPPLLDAALHGALGAHALVGSTLHVPTRIDRVVVHAPLAGELTARARLRPAPGDQLVADVDVFDAAGAHVCALAGVGLRPVAAPDPDAAWLDARSYVSRWEQAPATPRSGPRRDRWSVAGASHEVIAALAATGTPVSVVPWPRGPTATEAEALVVALAPASPAEAIRDASAVVSLVQGLAGRPAAELVLVTRDAVVAAAEDRVAGAVSGWVAGLRRTVANEVDGLAVRHVDWDGADPEALAAAIVEAEDQELALRGAVVHAPTVERLAASEAEAAGWDATGVRPAAEVASYALVRSAPGPRGLRWIAEERRAPAEGEVELRIEAVGLNFKDVAKQLGLLRPEVLARRPGGDGLGMEECVVVERVGPGVDGLAPGDRLVAGLAGGFRRHVTVAVADVLMRPARPEWSDAEAAGLLVAFLTAHHTIAELAATRPGEVVLVHGATGGLGQAALQVARWCGARVFATAGTPERRARLEEWGAERTFDSRTLDFVAGVLDATGGVGADVVLSTLPDDGLRANLEVAAPGGRVVELGRREVIDRRHLPLRLLDKNVTLCSFDLDLLTQDRGGFLALADRAMARFAAGDYRAPVPTVVPSAELEEALALIRRAEHTGKLVVDLADSTGLGCHERPRPAGPVRSDRWYLVTGGTGGLGLEVAGWLAARGARHLALVSRRAYLTPAGEEAVAGWRTAGVTVEVAAVDVTDRAALDAFVDRLRGVRPIGGVVHAAGVAHDRRVLEVTDVDVDVVLGPKLAGAHHLDAALADDPLDLFVLLSSVSALTGTTGQVAYAAANAALDALAQRRRRQGRPAIALSLGPVADVGMAAVTEEVVRYVRLYGFEPLPVERLPAVLDRALAWNLPVLTVADADWDRWHGVEPRAATSRRFAHLMATARTAPGAGADRTWAHLAEAPAGERLAALRAIVTEGLAKVLGVPADALDPERSLTTMGLDSLMIIELQSHLNQTLDADLSLMGLLGVDSIDEVARGIDDRLAPR